MADQRPANGGQEDLEKQPGQVPTVDVTNFKFEDNYEGGLDMGSSGLSSPTSLDEKARTSADLERFYAVQSRISTRGLPDEPPPPPDGGFEAWTQVACVSLCHTGLASSVLSY